MKPGNTNHLLQKLFTTLLVLVALSSLAFGVYKIAALLITESGPNTWIEYPPEGEIFGEGAIPIVVYASGDQGVGSITVNVGGEDVPVTELSPLVSDSTLVRADLLWQPPGEGEYTILASAGGAPASLNFCVITCESTEEEPTATATPSPAPGEPTGTATPTPAVSYTPTATSASSETPTATAAPSETPTPSATATAYNSPTPTSYTESSAEFWAAPPYINAGECTTLSWNVYGDFQAVYFEGASVNASGSDSECPPESYTYNLQVVEMDGSYTDYWASVDVSEPPPSDTTGASINWTDLVIEGCQFYGQAGISDESGVSWAQFYFNKNGEGWASIWMQEVSTDFWEMEVGIGVSDETVSIDYYVVTGDSLGNESESGVGNYYSDSTGCGGY